MLDVFEALGESDDLAGWDGLGLAIQAYAKRALPLIDWLARSGAGASAAAFPCAWSRAPIGIPRSSARRRWG